MRRLSTGCPTLSCLIAQVAEGPMTTPIRKSCSGKRSSRLRRLDIGPTPISTDFGIPDCRFNLTAWQ